MLRQLDDASAEPATDDESTENGEKEEPAPAQRSNRSRIWVYFDVLDKESRMAQCRLCAASLSYRTTMHNLRKHLERRHPLAAPGACASRPPDALRADKNAEKLSLKTKDMWQYFEVIDKKRGVARCAVCLKTLSFRTTTSNLLKHLSRKHLAAFQDEPKFHEEYLIEETEEAPDLSEPEFLETPKQNRTKRTRRPPPIPEDSDSDAHSASGRRKGRKKSVFDTFGAYITTLMQKLPEEVAMRMQADFVTQLINAQIAHQPRAGGDVLVLHATTSGACEISNSGSVVT